MNQARKAPEWQAMDQAQAVTWPQAENVHRVPGVPSSAEGPMSAKHSGTTDGTTEIQQSPENLKNEQQSLHQGKSETSVSRTRTWDK